MIKIIIQILLTILQPSLVNMCPLSSVFLLLLATK